MKLMNSNNLLQKLKQQAPLPLFNLTETHHRQLSEKLNFLDKNTVFWQTDSALNDQLAAEVQQPITLQHFDTIGSTNQYAKSLCNQMKLNAPHVIVSDQQTNGVGRYSRPFASQDGGLYVTLMMPDFQIETEQIGLLTTSLAMGVYDAIGAIFNQEVQIKWVNDIYNLAYQKIAGILVERGANQTLIIGVGINLHQDLPAELAGIAGNLLAKQPSSQERQAFLCRLIRELLIESRQFDQGRFLPRYRQHMLLMNRQVEVKLGQQTISGEVTDVDDTGQLIVLEQDGRQPQRINAGEVVKIYY
ncbi:hypothetical protein FD04_GL000942 [Secundilactobacillus odoratitofui DSM 19909 = JCM 15043]|uniref:biotin--[biotin carboxyl-carrier protein] ligase n=2 Tax=Secundilactobacillus odoratitofui TaxID=480930 RepID=A0A0R1LQ67_9LACO|nr:hypothetical protein FD04_GL000942 [Secundilactobacillus odoratitofui DSM 19909 = JCM 15043]